MKKLLLTGATGFIGRNIIPLATEIGYDIYAVYPPFQSALAVKEERQVFWCQCDLLNTDELRALVTEVKPTHLLHFAWDTTPGGYWTSPENLRWVQASLELIRSFVDQGGERAVFAGSCAEYDWEYGYCSEAVTPRNPRTLYGICKNSLQDIFSEFCKQKCISSAWGRIFFLYGPYEVRSRLVPSVVVPLLQDKVASCTHGNQIRDFLYVEDVASAFVSLLESSVEGPVNIASGQPLAVKTIVYIISDLLDRRHLIKLGALSSSEAEPPLLVADVRRLNQQVGWKPSVALEAGLRNTVEWWKKNLGGNEEL